MNTADYCARARELYAEYLALKGTSHGSIQVADGQLIQVERAVREAHRRWQEHIKDCYECKGK